ncbi:sigma-54 dependent transcriptional regulator [bacterium]|nr:sigma-54 dependent transcriptional regulator [bacterium]
MARLLVVDDDKTARRTLQLAFEAHGHEILTAGTRTDGLQLWRDEHPDLVLLDLMLPDGTGQEMLESADQENLGGIIIMITGHQDLERAINAMQAGAFDYIHKPLDIDELEVTVEKALEHLSTRRNLAIVADLSANTPDDRIVGQSRTVLDLHKQIGILSRGKTNVLITGESGTGKELVARSIHRHSAPDEPFIPVNCSALAPALLESELFGHEKGSFTGADRQKPGRMELAGQGTLFLDEIGDLDPSLQVKLLRVLQEREFERVGGTKPLPFRARVIAATNRDLEALIPDGQFREDLYFRLKVGHIHLPPLRERLEDLQPLVEHLLVKANRQLHRQVSKVSDEVLDRLKDYPWPGNVRELENRIHVAVMTSPGDTLQMDTPDDSPRTGESVTAEAASWRQSLAEMEKQHIRTVLREVNNNFGEACNVLGISRPTLRRKMREYGLRKD